jgi:Fe-S-cluster-containing hydrogenase component 2
MSNTACASDVCNESGIVLIDGEKCLGCKNCVITCPVGAVEIVEITEIARRRKTQDD